MTQPKPRDAELERLYRRAFAEYGVHALWNLEAMEFPNAADAAVIARALRREGDLRARQLAEQIERACRAADKCPD